MFAQPKPEGPKFNPDLFAIDLISGCDQLKPEVTQNRGNPQHVQKPSLSLSRKPLPLIPSATISASPAHLETTSLAIDHKLVVSSGSQLSGHVHISGSKNSALAILAGALCCAAGLVVVHSVLDLSDTQTMTTVLWSAGAWMEKAGSGEVVVDASVISSIDPSLDDVGRIQAGFFVLSPLMGRFGEIEVALPGGCKIGVRPIDLYLRGLSALKAVAELS